MSQSLPLAEVRALFPHSRDQIYLNHAAISPFSTHVVAALEAFIQQRHLDEIENYWSMLPKIQDLRERLARLVGGRAEGIAFVPNTSFGLNLLATGLKWQAGDRILLNRLEFPANVYPFLNCRRFGVEVDFVEPRADRLIHLDDIAAAIRPQTRLLSISHVQFLTGQRVDLAALGQLCRARGLLFCVDAIQSLGATDLDVRALNIDFLATGGHKWLMGPQGQGFVHITHELIEKLEPAMVGWLSVQDAWNLLDYQLKLRPDAARFETGSFNALGLTGMLAAQEVFARWPMAEIRNHVLDLSGFLIHGLQELGLKVITPAEPEQRLGIVTCEHPEADQIREGLEAHQIKVSAREGSYLRFAPHFYNSRAELTRVLKQLKQQLGKQRRSCGIW
ncbi:MAG TPA: aminotransferase class V-fold PLP-dependent enzyme [Candidatus Obscuribacterales bacterium]